MDEHLNENRFTVRPTTEVAAKIIQPADQLLWQDLKSKSS